MAHDMQQLQAPMRKNRTIIPKTVLQDMLSLGSCGLQEVPTHTQERPLPQPQDVMSLGSSEIQCAPTHTKKTPLPQPRELKSKKGSKRKSYFLCSVLQCDEKFSCLELLQTHMKLHLEIKPFICNICGKVCQTENRLNVHQERHSNDGEKCKCDICGRSFSRAGGLKRHKARIHKPLPHICPYCDLGFEEHRYMVIHAKRAHQRDPTTESSEQEHHLLHTNLKSSDQHTQENIDGGKNVCSYDSNDNGNVPAQPTPASYSSFECEKEQKLRECDTNNVVKTSVNIPTIKCEMCTSLFPYLSYLEQHMAVHINEKKVSNASTVK